LQRDAFGDYLIAIEHPNGKKVKKAKIVRLKMEWRTKSNNVDCGVFAMRHMKTYKGTGLAGWQSGFCKEEQNDHQQKQLNDLRHKYTTKLILHDINECKKEVLGLLRLYLLIPVESRRDLDKTAFAKIAQRMAYHLD